MDTEQLAIRYFTKLKGKKQRINLEEFRTAINVLKHEATVGFEEEQVEALIDAIVHIEDLPSSKFQELLKCIIPRKKVPEKAALKLLQWIFTYHTTANVGSIVAALEWIIGLVEFNLTSEDAVHAFYQHMFVLLEKRRVAKFASKLIHLLTKPSDVFRWRVKKVLDIEAKYGRQNHTVALLGLFKSYKPECVPESIPAINLQFAFQNVGRINPYFQQAQQRLDAEGRETHKRKVVWKTDEGMKRVKKRGKTLAIPPVDYVHFESARYRTESLHSILEFKNITALSSHLHELDIPCNSMSLLQNEIGMHIITFGGKSLQIRFSYNLYYTLCKVFIEQETGYSYEEKENLLTQVVALEEYMQQGIPVVSKFLAEYLCMWDAEDFRDTIFHLLQWISFSCYQELHDLILDHIHTIFLCGSIEVKSAVIAMLNKFVQNVILFGVFEGSENSSNVFLKNEWNWNKTETVKSIIEFVSNLCELGLGLEQGNYLLLNEALNFFEMMVFLQEHCKLPHAMWTMTPPVVMYNGLITRNTLMLSRVSDLLLKYENGYRRVKKPNLRRKLTEHIDYQKMYLIDFTNCLLGEKCFDNQESYLFKDVPESHLRRLSKYIVPNEALILKTHFALLPYIAKMQKDSEILQSSPFDYEDMLIIIINYLEEIDNLLHLGNAK